MSNASSSHSSPYIFNPLQNAMRIICRLQVVCVISPEKPFFKALFISLNTVLLMLGPSLGMLNNLSKGKPVYLIA